MRLFIKKIKYSTICHLKENYIAFIVAIFVGLVYLLPNLFFIISAGDNYKGVPIMQTANEDFYLARIKEIIDGHFTASSPAFFEYKNQHSLQFPTGEYFYAITSMLFNISPVDAIIFSRLFLPPILFLLVYFLIRRLTINTNLFSNKINAVSGGLFVVFGYDLLDYRHVLSSISGKYFLADYFLLWARPVNPILGGVFLMSFLLLIFSIGQKAKKNWFYVAGASVFLALMISTYFFSWVMAFMIAGVFAIILFLKKDYKKVIKLLEIFFLGILLAIPYLYTTWQMRSISLNDDSFARSGMFYTHYPMVNKLMLAVLVLYLIVTLFINFLKRRNFKNNPLYSENWFWFCLALIVGSLAAYNQQIITGRTVWPYHFVQYSIPLSIIVVMVLFYNFLRKNFFYLWVSGISIIVGSSLFFGVYTQIIVYKKYSKDYLDKQKYALLFDWLNEKEKDCVVLVGGDFGFKERGLNYLIPAFTHCNVYDSDWVFFGIPYERVRHNYFFHLLFNGVTEKNIEEYLARHKEEVRAYSFSNWKGLFNVKDFPDFPDDKIEERIKKIKEEYPQFLSKELKSELKKYKINYIITKKDFPKMTSKIMNQMDMVYSLDDIGVYQFK